jgi:exopolysaccharide production protein ExoZ
MQGDMAMGDLESQALPLTEWLERRFELSSGSQDRLLPMEGLRGVAVLLAFSVHYVSLMHPWIAKSAITGLATGLDHIGNTGVDLFFVLSGYLIYGMLIRKPRPFVGFMQRRIQRLYPTFIVVFVVYVLLSVALPAESRIPRTPGDAARYLLENFLLMPGIFDIPPLITVAWSLSYEMTFYLTVPLLVGLLAMRRWDWRLRAGLFVAVIASWQWLHLPHTRLIDFAAGMLLVDTLPHLQGRRWIDVVALVMTVACVVPGWIIGRHGFVITLVCVYFYVLCLAAFANRGPASRLLSVRPLRWLGNMSYSYYLLHGLTLKAFFLALARVVRPTGDQAALFAVLMPVALLATFVTSAVLYLLVEYPYSIQTAPAAPGAPSPLGSVPSAALPSDPTTLPEAAIMAQAAP